MVDLVSVRDISSPVNVVMLNMLISMRLTIFGYPLLFFGAVGYCQLAPKPYPLLGEWQATGLVPVVVDQSIAYPDLPRRTGAVLSLIR